MNGLPYYKAYPRDFIEGTIGMPFEVKCAYRVVLDLIYMQRGNLPDDARYISGLLGCTIKKWKSIRQHLIEAGKIEVSGEFLTNNRAIIELKTLSKLQENQREKASNPRKNKDLQQPQQSQPEPKPDKEKKEEANASSQKRGSRLSPGWHLPKAWGDWAVAEGLTEAEVRQESERFGDYWRGIPGAKGVKLDWLATWRNWIRKAVEDRQARPGLRTIQGGKIHPKRGDLKTTRDGRVLEWDGWTWECRNDLAPEDVLHAILPGSVRGTCRDLRVRRRHVPLRSRECGGAGAGLCPLAGSEIREGGARCVSVPGVPWKSRHRHSGSNLPGVMAFSPPASTA